VASFSDPPARPTAPGLDVAMRWRRETQDVVRQIATPRYAAAAAVALPLIGLALLRFGASGRFAVAALFIGALCVLSAIDLTEGRLPNRIVLPTTGIVLAAQIVLFPDRALEWILAAIGAAVVLLLPLLLFRDGVGMGDVKLMLLLGAALGSAVATALVVASLAAAAYAVFLLMRGGGDARRASFPLGPFLAFGALVALLL
jgi:prepilin signal peptidase PulO-like enzyme (type II secretory pathway)